MMVASTIMHEKKNTTAQKGKDSQLKRFAVQRIFSSKSNHLAQIFIFEKPQVGMQWTTDQ
jgi:hypothetical protein